MKRLLLLKCLYCYVSFCKLSVAENDNCGENEDSLDISWREYKTRYNKQYSGYIEERRKAAYMRNCAMIRSHNRQAKDGKHSFTITDNSLADMGSRMYHRTMTKLIHSRKRDLNPDIVGAVNHEALPETMDWREVGFKTAANNQKDCGSCYAFSITQVLQAQVYKQTNVSVPLSVQQLVDCSSAKGNLGCAGGSLRNTLRYLDASGGVMTDSAYPYTAKQGACKFDRSKVAVNVTSWAILPPHDEATMAYVVGRLGPVAASINASPHTFQLYRGGVYDEPRCPADRVNHAVLVVGYTRDAWILKNWWGERWGERGYMRLRRGGNTCGILNYVAYALV